MNLATHFAEHGFARLERAFAAEAGAMADAIRSELRRSRTLRPLRRKGIFDALATPAMRAAIGELLGKDGWPQPFSWGDPLVTLPTGTQWNVPIGGWHLDFPARSTLMLKWLGYLAPVRAGGGGTVVLAGSHRLVERYLTESDPADPGRSAVVREAVLGGHPWLRSLRDPGDPAARIARLMRQGATVDGIAVRVVELTGQPGDVVFLHPHLFHAPASNCRAEPRLMVTGGLMG